MRLLFRLVGFLGVAAGFVALLIDGARFLADKTFSATPLGAIAFSLLKERFLLIQPAVERHVHPFLWQFVLQPVFETPAFVVLFVFGFVLLWLGRKPAPEIGYATEGRR